MPIFDAPVRAWIYERLADVFDGVPPSFGDPPSNPVDWPVPIAAAVSSLASTPIDRDTFAAEHVRLFVNAKEGVAAPPYASWYLDGALLGPSCAWVAAAYATQGLDIDPGAGEPPDYLPAELEYLFFLVRHDLAARATGDDAALRAVLGAEADFVRHLARWVPSFVDRIRAAAPHPAFATAAALLAAAIAEEVHRLPCSTQQGDCHWTPR